MKNKNTLYRLFEFTESCKGLKSFLILQFNTPLFKYVPAITV